jgi:hypothetical protein
MNLFSGARNFEWSPAFVYFTRIKKEQEVSEKHRFGKGKENEKGSREALWNFLSFEDQESLGARLVSFLLSFVFLVFLGQ